MQNEKDENRYCSKCKASISHSKKRDEIGELQYVCKVCGTIKYKGNSQRIKPPDSWL